MKQDLFVMDAEAVTAYVNAMYPQAAKSPLANLFSEIASNFDAETAVDFARLSSMAVMADIHRQALGHAMSCIDVCEADGIEYDAETLSHNIESNYPELNEDECDKIAAQAIRQFHGY